MRIYSDAGRILRPLLVVENLGKIKRSDWDKSSFRSLLNEGVIELIGTEEEEDCFTAWGVQYLFSEAKTSVRYTHCELDMSFLLGLSCSLVPFANHDHARRVLYQSQKHSSQAIGFPTENPSIRVDTLSNQLHYPQRPLFHTMTSECLGKPERLTGHVVFPKAEFYNGQNAIVAVNVHLGYNQEDSLVMNAASLQRGMFKSEHIRSYKAEIDNKESTEKKRKPEDVINFGNIQSTRGRADCLDDDGFPYVGASLQSGDIIIGRCSDSGTDHSIKLKHTERGYVQKVVLSSNDEGKNFAVVSLRQVKTYRCPLKDACSTHAYTLSNMQFHIMKIENKSRLTCIVGKFCHLHCRCRFAAQFLGTNSLACMARRVSWDFWSLRRTFLLQFKGSFLILL